MRQFLGFELTMAIQDRPKPFQLITLGLFSLSLTIIFIGFFSRVTAPADSKQVYKKTSTETQATFASSSANKFLTVHQK